jgi:RecB family endonuclease NucS
MSLDEIRSYVRKRLNEGVETLYGWSGLAGEVAKKFGLKLSTAGYRVWEVLRTEKVTGESIDTVISAKNEKELEVEEKEKELITGGFKLEEELERQISSNPEIIEKGLRIIGRQYKTSAGVIDILAEDRVGTKVVIELKSGDADIGTISQILRYMTAVKREYPESYVRGIIIAHDFDDILIESIKSFLKDKIELINYEIKITLRSLT